MSLLLCDLDNFKRLNDNHGHATGTPRCWSSVACLLVDADASVAAQVAERIRRECGELMLQAAEPVNFSVSIGLAATEQAGYDLAILLARADEALYRAKAGGRDRVELYRG